MISSILSCVCFLVVAYHSVSTIMRVICVLLSLFSFVVAMACHQKVIKRVERLERIVKSHTDQFGLQCTINNQLTDMITEDDMK